jgi:hypothetical protein
MWKSPLSAKFSDISRPWFHLCLLGFARVVSDVGDTWWRVLERSNHWSSKLGGLTCRWQRHSVKTFLLRIFNDSWAGHNPQGLQCRLKKIWLSWVAWGGVMVKALRYYSDGPGIDSRWCHWIFQWYIPSDRSMVLGSTQSLVKMNTRNISWG